MFTKALRKFVPGMGWDEIKALTDDLTKEEEELPADAFLVTPAA